MPQRHTELRDAASGFRDENLADYLLSTVAERKVEALLKNLGELSEILLKLQTADCSMRMPSVYFSSILGSYPDLDRPLVSDAKIVESPSFEQEVVEIQDRRKAYSTTSEK